VAAGGLHVAHRAVDGDIEAVDEGRYAAGFGEPAHGRPLPDGCEVAGDLHDRVGRAG
jgi:hypothetical protein